MKIIKNTDFHAERWFYLFAFIHLICWTAVPALVRYNLPLDTIEGTIWGHQLVLCYYKNQIQNGWLTRLAIELGGQSGWMTYLFCQLSVITCFWVVWQIGKKALTPAYALVSVMLLEGVQFYNFHAIDFNDNTLELGAWGLTIYFFYRSLRSPTIASWMLTGAFAGVGMMAKYYTLALLAAMGLLLLINKKHRAQLATLPPYLGLAILLAIILPHTIWLFFHDFITVKYVFARADSLPSWTNHIFFPLEFAWQQFQVFLPSLVLFGILLLKKPRLSTKRINLSTFDKEFLFYIGLGPLLLTLLLSLCLGTKLRAGWGQPLLSFWGLILMAVVQPYLTPKRIYAFMGIIYSLLVLTLVIYCYSIIDSPDVSSANFQGKELAEKITQQWHDTYHTKLEYIGGARWSGGNVGFHSSDHPAVWIEWSSEKAPWVDVDEMKKKGAVFIWTISDREKLPKDIYERFPRLHETQVIELPLYRNTRHLPPVKIGVAVLPPEWGFCRWGKRK
ncbi:MAG: glycosyltransferase family 39 protein [Gammaproteobacteria bacterium]